MLPDQHLFQLGDGITVSEFAREDEGFRFETYELAFKADIAVGEQTTAALIQLETSYEPGVWHEVATELDVVRVDERKLFEPHIGLGITGSVPIPDVTGSVWVSFIHPTNSWDIGVARISMNNNSLRVGIDPVAYNIGDRLPVLTDTWIAPGASIKACSAYGFQLITGKNHRRISL